MPERETRIERRKWVQLSRLLLMLALVITLVVYWITNDSIIGGIVVGIEIAVLVVSIL